MSTLGTSILDGPLVFVDIETNGLSHIRGRVIEVAAIRIELGRVVKTFNSLVDPETELPQFITNLTGITDSDIKGATTFHQIATELKDVLEGATFVAHNVRFDYSFLKQEFGRVGMTFRPKQLCTVKLSRALYPHEKGHKLADLIQRHNFSFAHRHRAYDDAAVLWQFLQHVRKHFPPEQVEAAVAKQINRPSLPRDLEPELVRNLPETPGVYIFEDATHRPLYVGKSVNIKKRVMSHFGRDHAESREFKIAQTIKHISAQQTPTELSALLLESSLIKELQPLYNRRLRRTSKLLLAKQQPSEKGYFSVGLEESTQIDPSQADQILAIYPGRGRAKDSLNEMVRLFDLCPKLMGLEKTSGACFLRQLHKCRGACVAQEPAEHYNARLLMAFDRQRIHTWPYRGPILVEEQLGSDSTHGIVVDQWCVLAELTQEADCEPVVKLAEKAFDLDAYKILQSHLSRKLQQLTIKPLSSQQLAQLVGN